MIRFSCPKCKLIVGVADDDAGVKMACARCGQRLQVPARVNKTVLGEMLPEWPGAGSSVTLSRVAEPPPLPVQSIQSLPMLRYEPAPHRNGRKGESEAGTICSNLSCTFGAVAFLLCPPLFGVAGIALGIVGATLSRDKKKGTIGTVLSVVGMIVGMVLGAMAWRVVS